MNAAVTSATISGRLISGPSSKLTSAKCRLGVGDPVALKGAGYPQRVGLAPRRGDDLHADRQFARLAQWRGDDRQPDERQRLGIDADERARRNGDAVDLDRLLADLRRRARGRRSEQDVDIAEQRQHLLAIPAPETLRALHPESRNQSASQETVAGHRVEILRPRLEVRKVEL